MIKYNILLLQMWKAYVLRHHFTWDWENNRQGYSILEWREGKLKPDCQSARVHDYV